MRKIFIKSRDNYDIPCIFEYEGNEKSAVIISHGFGSSKESPTAVTVAERLKKEGVASVRFDFPAHGESNAQGKNFRIDNCLSDLSSVERYLEEKLPQADIYYFSSSFGAFINLIYLSRCEHSGKKSFLRCAAVDMPGIVASWMNPEYERELEETGYIFLDEDYIMPLRVPGGFLEDLREIDLFADFKCGDVELHMIHGTEDETAPFEDAKRFSEKYNIQMTEIKGADHRFTPIGAMDRVRDEAIKFFKGI